MKFKFNPGDLVRVHHVASSKTPVMSIVGPVEGHSTLTKFIISIGEINWYTCRWFWEGEFKSDTFREEELEIIAYNLPKNES